jgi:hypothetical protein
VLALLGVGACTRGELEEFCPTDLSGAIVLTEIRGPQSGADTRGQWFELHNAAGVELDLAGLAIELRELDGGRPARILVREDPLPLADGAYVVLGRSPNDDLLVDGDYGFAGDFESDLYDGGIIDVTGCGGAILDRVIYRDLPSAGTWAFDGTSTPDAEANDDEDRWCVDDEPAGTDEPASEAGVPGSPGEDNPPCP